MTRFCLLRRCLASILLAMVFATAATAQTAYDTFRAAYRDNPKALDAIERGRQDYLRDTTGYTWDGTAWVRTFKPGGANAAERPFYVRRLREVGIDPNQVPSAVMELADNIVRVQANDGSWGSGAYLGDRLVLTADHVIRDGSAFAVHFRDGTAIPAKVVRRDGNYDQALLELQRPHPTATGIPLADQNLPVGSFVVVGGYDKARPTLLFRPGLVRGYSMPAAGWPADWFELDNQVQSGSSGGPALTADGKLVGTLWGAGSGVTVAVSCGRTRRFLLPWNARLEAWRLALQRGRSPTQICGPGGWGSGSGGGLSPSAPGGRPTIPVPPGAPTTPTPAPQPAAPELSMEVGTVETVDPEARAAVTLRRENGKYVLDFRIPRGKPGEQGPAGAPGAPGPQGPPGQPASINVEALAAAIRDTLPPITVNSVDSRGRVMDTVTVPLGGTLNIHHKPIPKQ